MSEPLPSTCRILLVDDHHMVREGVRQMLANDPLFEVVGEAASGAAARVQLDQLSPDLVLMDVHLPNENGVELSAELLKLRDTMKVVILTGNTDLATVQMALQAGVSGYITKDASKDELLRGLREALEHRVFLSPAIANAVIRDYMQAVVSAPAPSKRSPLSDRERLLVKLVAEGMRNKEIADALNVNLTSVETYRSRLMRKLNCTSPADLTRYAIREGIIEP